MEFNYVRKDIDILENKDEVTLEDIMKVASDLGLDITGTYANQEISIQELPVSDPRELSVYLRRWAVAIYMIVKKHRSELMQEERFSKLEQFSNYLNNWDDDMEAQMLSMAGADCSISDITEESSSGEEKMRIYSDLQNKLDEHISYLENKKQELLREKKKLAIDMLRLD